MTTIKSHTDISQSRKLSEILSLESADHFHIIGHHHTDGPRYEVIRPRNEVVETDKYWPCWSLAALLDILPNNENISTNLSKGGYKISTLEYTNSWFVEYEDETDCLNNYVASADNPVDACVEMIIHLNKLNLL